MATLTMYLDGTFSGDATTLHVVSWTPALYLPPVSLPENQLENFASLGVSSLGSAVVTGSSISFTIDESVIDFDGYTYLGIINDRDLNNNSANGACLVVAPELFSNIVGSESLNDGGPAIALTVGSDTAYAIWYNPGEYSKGFYRLEGVWATAHDAATADGFEALGYGSVGSTASSGTGTYNIYRLCLTFDTSILTATPTPPTPTDALVVEGGGFTSENVDVTFDSDSLNSGFVSDEISLSFVSTEIPLTFTTGD